MATYTVKSELGRGGMGVVYRATQEPLGRDVALKVLLPELSSNRDHCARFIREIKLLMKAEHPNIIRVFDCGENAQGWFYAMEMLEAQPLDVISRRTGAMEPLRAFKLLHQAVDALAYCHSLGLLHRDIKLSNMMVDARDHLTLMDFGLARLEGGTVMTAAGKIVGTPRYAAPEVLMGKPATPAADVYAMGISLHELLDGWPAFTADNLRELMRMILTEGPTPLEKLHPELPGAIPGLVRRCVANDPAQRPSSAALKEELARVIAQLKNVETWSPSMEMSSVEAIEAAGDPGAGAGGANAPAGASGSRGGSGPPVERSTASQSRAGTSGAPRAPLGSGSTRPSRAMGALTPGQAPPGGAQGTGPEGTSPAQRAPGGVAGTSGTGLALLGGPAPSAAQATSRATGRIRVGSPTGRTAVPFPGAAVGPSESGLAGRLRQRPWMTGGLVATTLVAVLALTVLPRSHRLDVKGDATSSSPTGASAGPASTATAATGEGLPSTMGPGAGALALEAAPPRKVRVRLASAPSAAGSLEVEALEGDRPAGRVPISPGGTASTIVGLSTGHSYQIRLLAAGRPVPGLDQPFTMPRPLQAWGMMRVGDDHVGVNLQLSDPAPIERQLLRADGSPAAEPRVYRGQRRIFEVVRGLRSETDYRVEIRPLDTDRYIPQRTFFFKTRPAGLRRRIDSLIEGLSLPMGQDWQSADQLGDLGEVDAVPGICKVLGGTAGSMDEPIVVQLLRAVRNSYNPAAIPTLLHLLEGPPDATPETRLRATFALGEMREPAAFDALARQGARLELADENVYMWAMSLVHCDDARAILLFRDIATHPQGRTPLERLAAPEGLLQSRCDDLAPAVTRMALDLGDARQLEWTADRLATVATPLCQEGLRLLATRLVQPPGPADPEVLVSILVGLARAGQSQDAALAMPLMEGRRPPAVREAAARCVAVIGKADTAATMVRWLDDTDTQVRRAAAAGLGRLRAREAVTPLTMRLADHAASLGRYPRALGEIGDGRAADALLALAQAPAVASRGAAGAPPSLDAAADLDRAAALWALGRLGERRARPALLAALRDPSVWTRMAAVRALEWMGDPADAVPLDALAASDPAPLVKDSARRAVERIHNGKGASGRVLLVDPSLPVARTGLLIEPGESVVIESMGCWAADARTPPVGPAGGGAIINGHKKLMLLGCLLPTTDDETGAHQGPRTFGGSGELRLWAHAASPADAVGFLEVVAGDE